MVRRSIRSSSGVRNVAVCGLAVAGERGRAVRLGSIPSEILDRDSLPALRLVALARPPDSNFGLAIDLDALGDEPVLPTAARSPPCGPLRRCKPTCRIWPMIEAGGVICGRMPSGIGTVASRSMTTCRA